MNKIKKNRKKAKQKTKQNKKENGNGNKKSIIHNKRYIKMIMNKKVYSNE